MSSEAEERLVLALEAAELGTWTWDMAAGTTVSDTRLEQLHGLEPGGFGGTYQDWLATMHPADRDEYLARVEHALANPGPYLLLHRTTWPDGTVRWIECRGRVTVDEAGAPTGTIGVTIDVTDREDHGAVVAEQLEQERRIVETLQHALLPSALPTVPGVSVAAPTSRPRDQRRSVATGTRSSRSKAGRSGSRSATSPDTVSARSPTWPTPASVCTPSR